MSETEQLLSISAGRGGGGSEGSGEIAIPYQFSWKAISDLVVKLGTCRPLVPNAWPAPWKIAALLKPFVALFCNTSITSIASCGYLVCANWLAV